jgi:hypothetical protein
MALPKITHPLYQTTLPSTGKPIKYRGFLAVEQKILLLAVQSESPAQMTMALKQILRNCIVDKIDIERMIITDCEWMYLQIVQKSLGEEIVLAVACGNCSEEINYTLALNNIPIPVIVKKANVIKIDSDMYVTLKYPTLDTLDDLVIINETDRTYTTEEIIVAIARNIECVSTSEETFDFADQTFNDIAEWFDGFDSKQFALITKFFDNIPTIEEKIEFTCACGYKNVYGIRGIADLFL